MIDFGIDKIALIGAVALVVLGPERLPRVARTVGHLLGKAQRYVADVKAEVNRSIELEELKKMKGQFEDAARNVEQTVSNEIHQTTSDLEKSWADADPLSPDYKNLHDGWTPTPTSMNNRAAETSGPAQRSTGVTLASHSDSCSVECWRPRQYATCATSRVSNPWSLRIAQAHSESQYAATP